MFFWKRVSRLIFVFLLIMVTGFFHDLCAESYYFADDFEGTSLDVKIWQSEQTLAPRWCGDEQNGFAPGKWLNMATSSCYSAMQPPPYGSIDVGEGGVHLASTNEHVFPYFFTGPAGRRSPFPPSGDFTLVIRLRHDYIGGAGNGVYIRFWEDAQPEGDNPPVTKELRVFSIWADQNSSRIGLMGQTVIYPDIPGLFKVYRLDYIDGQYSAYIDDRLVAGPIKSAVRPNVIWIGNPLALWWISSGEAGWTKFTIDYIRISQPFGPTAKKRKDR